MIISHLKTCVAKQIPILPSNLIELFDQFAGDVCERARGWEISTHPLRSPLTTLTLPLLKFDFPPLYQHWPPLTALLEDISFHSCLSRAQCPFIITPFWVICHEIWACNFASLRPWMVRAIFYFWVLTTGFRSTTLFNNKSGERQMPTNSLFRLDPILFPIFFLAASLPSLPRSPQFSHSVSVSCGVFKAVCVSDLFRLRRAPRSALVRSGIWVRRKEKYSFQKWT